MPTDDSLPIYWEDAVRSLTPLLLRNMFQGYWTATTAIHNLIDDRMPVTFASIAQSQLHDLGLKAGLSAVVQTDLVSKAEASVRAATCKILKRRVRQEILSDLKTAVAKLVPYEEDETDTTVEGVKRERERELESQMEDVEKIVKRFKDTK